MAFSDEQLTTMRQKLGLAEDADEATIVAALVTTVDERPEPTPTAQLPEGTVAVDQAMLEQLRTDAAAGREARAQQQAERRERLVQAAVNDGRIPPARRDAWLAQLAADEGAEQTLAGLAPGLIPVDERGHDQAEAESGLAFNQAEYDALASSLGIKKGA